MKEKKLKKKRERQKKNMEHIEKSVRYRGNFASYQERRNMKVNVSVLFWGGLGSREERNN